MQKTDLRRMEMIRRRENAGFCYLNRSFLCEHLRRVPSLDELEKLLADGWWDDSSSMSGFVNAHDGQVPPVETKLRVVYDDEAIFAGFFMEEPEMNQTCAHVTEQGTREIKLTDPVSGKEVLPYEIVKDDHVELLLDFGHTHRTYVQFLVNLAGVTYADEIESWYRSEAVYPVRRRFEKWGQDYDSSVIRSDNSWCAGFRIPWSSVGIAPSEPSVLGINAVRSRTIREWNHHVLCFAPYLGGVKSPSEFGDLYLGEAPIALEEIDFAFPVFAENAFAAKIRNNSDKPLALRCSAELTLESSEKPFSSDSADLELSPNQCEQVGLKYKLDWQERGTQTLRFSISDSTTGTALLVTPYFFGYNTDMTVEQPYRFETVISDPDPGDDDFIVKKRDYLLSRLPRFVRITTAEGGPSDFTLRSACKKYEFNLMKSGVLKEIAKMIEDLFPDRNDRLAAAVMLAHQKPFSMHIGPHVSLHRQVTPLSALRLNAGHCYSRALVWMGIVRNLSDGEGGLYGFRVHGLLVLGHVMGAIDLPGGDRMIFDPTIGAFYYHWDNTRFATGKELQDDPKLGERMVRGNSRFFSLREYYRAIPSGQIVFPQGAVGE